MAETQPKSNLPDGMYRLLFEHASDAIFSVRLANMCIQSANPKLEEMTGYVVRQLIGSRVDPLVPQNQSNDDAGRLFSPELLNSPGLYEDIRLRKVDDHLLFGSIAVGHLPDPDGTLAVCVLRDTTERRLLERELITKHMALREAHNELLSATRALEKRNNELMDLSNRIATLTKQAAIGEFTAGVAHSINNPLAALLSSIRQMGKVLPKLSQKDLQERLMTLLDRQSQGAERIQQVVVDVRNVHKSGAPAAEFAIREITNELDKALSLFSHRTDQMEIIKDYFGEQEIEIIPDQLQYLFCNLIDNALLAMEYKGRLAIKTQIADSRLLISFEDNGPGLPAEIRERLFEPFVTTRSGGTGLGLSSAQRVAQMHRGKLSCMDVEPTGTCFTLEIPCLQNKEA